MTVIASPVVVSSEYANSMVTVKSYSYYAVDVNRPDSRFTSAFYNALVKGTSLDNKPDRGDCSQPDSSDSGVYTPTSQQVRFPRVPEGRTTSETPTLPDLVAWQKQEWEQFILRQSMTRGLLQSKAGVTEEVYTTTGGPYTYSGSLPLPAVGTSRDNPTIGATQTFSGADPQVWDTWVDSGGAETTLGYLLTGEGTVGDTLPTSLTKTFTKRWKVDAKTGVTQVRYVKTKDYEFDVAPYTIVYPGLGGSYTTPLEAYDASIVSMLAAQTYRSNPTLWQEMEWMDGSTLVRGWYTRFDVYGGGYEWIWTHVTGSNTQGEYHTETVSSTRTENVQTKDYVYPTATAAATIQNGASILVQAASFGPVKYSPPYSEFYQALATNAATITPFTYTVGVKNQPGGGWVQITTVGVQFIQGVSYPYWVYDRLTETYDGSGNVNYSDTATGQITSLTYTGPYTTPQVMGEYITKTGTRGKYSSLTEETGSYGTSALTTQLLP